MIEVVWSENPWHRCRSGQLLLVGDQRVSIRRHKTSPSASPSSRCETEPFLSGFESIKDWQGRQEVRCLLCLAEIDFADGWGESLLHDITSILHQKWLPAVWGMSVGAYLTEDAVLPYEVSLTRRPAFDDARVLAVGADALATWELLTEAPNASVIQGVPAAELDQGARTEVHLRRGIARRPLAWANTRLVDQDPVEAVRSVKEAGAPSLRTIGSLTLSRSLLEAGLVDRFRAVVFPVITGSTGRERIYDGYPDAGLEMVASRTFAADCSSSGTCPPSSPVRRAAVRPPELRQECAVARNKVSGVSRSQPGGSPASNVRRLLTDVFQTARSAADECASRVTLRCHEDGCCG
jgi:hypothetical protein